MGDIRIIGIFGNLGCYKTALMVALARMLSTALGIGIVGNLKLNIPNAKSLDISELVGVEYRNKIVCEDEIYTIADSRCSMSTRNVFYTYSVAQARKSNKDEFGRRGVGNFIIYTAQLTSMADCRLFDLTNLYILMNKLPNGDAEFESVLDDGTASSGVIPKEFFVREAFPFYDTDERVSPLGIESMRVEMEKFLPDKINARIDVAVDKIMCKYSFKSFKEVQLFTIHDFMRREGIPMSLKLDIYNRVRETVRMQGLSRQVSKLVG